MRANAAQWAPVRYSTTRFGGGVTGTGIAYPGGYDITTPALSLQSGALKDVLNFECSQSGGYSRIDGYERVNGMASPSDAVYTIVQLTSFTNVPSLGQTLTQSVSGATGTIIVVNNEVGNCYIAITQLTGAFDATNALLVGATPIGTAITTNASITPLQNAQYLALAADVYRALIDPVPGSGAILGVVGMNFSGVDNIYAFRANVGATAVDIYKASVAGWVNVPLMKIVEFSTGGATQPAEGTTLTQGGVTSTIKRVMTRSGSWAGNTAAGGIVLDNLAGGNYAAGAATIGAITVTLLGVQTDITILTGGRFEFAKTNFTGNTSTRRIYGCDGVNKAFEFDGVVFAPITTGLTDDSPDHIAAHKNFLFLSKDSSLIHSAPGEPYLYSSVSGGGEIATGDNVNGMITLPGDPTTATLAIFMEGNTALLYGTDVATFNFTIYNNGQGGLPYAAQNLYDAFTFADLGVVTLRASLNFGSFSSNTLTKNILPFVIQQRSKLSASSIQRSKSQYRAFFNDGYGLWLTTVNQQYLGAAVILFPNPVSCCDNLIDSSGDEISYFGSSDGDGYVYELDVGTSFDGEIIDAYIIPAWDFLKSPRILKRFRAASIEMQGSSYAAITFGYQIAYGSSEVLQYTDTSYSSGFAGVPIWDQFTWDDFYWDGRTLFPTNVSIGGTSENIQPAIRVGTNYIASFTINSIIYHYSVRRGLRV